MSEWVDRIKAVQRERELFAPKPWVCMHGIDVTATGGCDDCARSLRETLAEARRREVVDRVNRERRDALAAHTLPVVAVQSAQPVQSVPAPPQEPT